MKKAIVSGSSGLIGRSVVNYLVDNDIDVLCLGRKNLTQDDINNYFGKRVRYIQLDMKNIEKLPYIINKLNWEVGDECLFYNFAWSGVNRLTDGTLEDQLKNAIASSLAVKSAKKIGCIKFINSGSVEENYSEWYLDNGLSHLSTQSDYAIAKLASRDMCSIVSYLQKIDYIHTRLSVPLSPDLSKGGYVSKTLKKIINKKKENYETPKNNQLYDIISTHDVAKAYYLIGLHGRNKADYFIGSGKPSTLNNYFENIKLAVSGMTVKKPEAPSSDFLNFFNTKNLHSDTGFYASSYLLDLVREEKTK
jgi:nucleoside-diphosphate-sugar epimerase